MTSALPQHKGIPQNDWSTTLGALCDRFGGEIQTGPFGSQLHASDYSDDGIPVVMPQDLVNAQIACDRIARVPENMVRDLSRHILRFGDVVFSRRGDVTRFAVVAREQEGWLCGTGCIRIRLNCPDVFIPYFRHYLQQESVGKWLMHEAKGVTMPNLNTGIVRALPFVYPPLEEQQRIAAILDQAEELRAKRRQALAKLDTLTQSLFLDMFGCSVELSKNVSARYMDEICLKITDGTHYSPEPQASGVPYITAKHVDTDVLDFDSDPTFVSEEAHAEIYKRCDPKRGDILYIKDGATTGKAAINHYSFEFSMLSSLALLRPDPRLCLPEFLCAWLNQPTIKNMLLGSMAGAAIRRLTLSKIKKFRIFLPKMKEQERFSEIMSGIRILRAKTIAASDGEDKILASLQHRAFRGEL